MKPWFRTLAIALIPSLTLAGTAAAGDADDAVEYRQSVMGIFYWTTDHMGKMVKGETPFDAGAFKGYADDLAAAAAMDILKGFPEDSITDDSDAKDEIWMDWADFESKVQAMRTQSAKLAEVAAEGDEAAIKDQFGETRKACKGCHDAYKQ